MAKKYLISIETEGDQDNEVFEFNSEEDRSEFIEKIKPIGASYTTSEVEKDPEEDEWKVPASTHVSVQKVGEISKKDLTVYESIRFGILSSKPILIYRISGEFAITQRPLPGGDISREELDRWLKKTTKIKDTKGSIREKIIARTFNIGSLKGRGKVKYK